MFVISGIVYVGGALGLEAVNDVLRARGAQFPSWPTVLTQTLEETLELAGVALFITTLVGYLEKVGASVTLAFVAAPNSPDPSRS
jgi:hypothetical protein